MLPLSMFGKDIKRKKGYDYIAVKVDSASDRSPIPNRSIILCRELKASTDLIPHGVLVCLETYSKSNERVKHLAVTIDSITNSSINCTYLDKSSSITIPKGDLHRIFIIEGHIPPNKQNRIN